MIREGTRVVFRVKDMAEHPLNSLPGGKLVKGGRFTRCARVHGGKAGCCNPTHSVGRSKNKYHPLVCTWSQGMSMPLVLELLLGLAPTRSTSLPVTL